MSDFLIDRFELEQIRGCLPAEFPMWMLNIDLLKTYVGQALEGQDDDIKQLIDGALMSVRPFTTDEQHEEPFLEFCVDDVPIVRISLSRLLPGASIRA